MSVCPHRQQLLALLRRVGPLLLQHGAAVTLMSCPEEQEVGKQFIQRPIQQALRLHGDAAAGFETEKVEAAKSRGVLILFTDRFSQNFDLNIRGLFRQLPRRYPLAAKRVEGVQKADGEATRPT